MKLRGHVTAGFALAGPIFAMPASAGEIENGSAQIGNVTVSFGGGVAFLDLPDVPSTLTFNETQGGARSEPFINGFKFCDNFGSEAGWNINGSVEAPAGCKRRDLAQGVLGEIQRS